MAFISIPFGIGVSPLVLDVVFTSIVGGHLSFIGIPPLSFGGYEIVVFFTLFILGLITFVGSEFLRLQ